MIKKLIISIFIFIFLLFPLKANQLKQITKINLSNDLTVLLQEDRRINLIALEFFLKTGLEEENEQISGINNLIANMLFKGTNKYTAIEINQKIELMGNTLNAQAYPDYILINALGSKENFPALLNLIVHCLNNPIFPEDEFKKVKEEILKKKEGSKSIFYALYENFLQNFYRYHPYRYPQEGYVKSLKNLTSKDLKEYYQTYFIPNKMVLSISGNFNKTEIINQIKILLGNLTPREIGPKKIDWEPPAEEQEIFLNVSSNLAWVFLGYPAPHFSSPDYPAMKLIYLALGEGISSKIWEELREKNALAYDLSAIFPELKGPSHIIFYVVTTPENTWAARKKLLLEINKIKKDGLLPQELKEAKNKFLGEYLLDRETNKGKAYNIGLTEIYELGYPYDFNLSKKIEAITNEEIKRIANLYLNNYTLIIAQAPNTNNIYYEMFR